MGLGQEGAAGLFLAFGLDNLAARRGVASTLRVFGGRAVAAAALDVLCEAEPSTVQVMRAIWREDPLLWRRIVRRWAYVRADERPRLIALLSVRELWVRFWAAEALGRCGSEDALMPLRAMLGQEDRTQHLPAALGLAYRGERSALSPLLKELPAGDAETRLVIADALGRLGAPSGQALARLRELQDAEPRPEAKRLYRGAIKRIERAVRSCPTELEASAMPPGLGTELEAAEMPAGTGTELEASGPLPGTGEASEPHDRCTGTR